MIRNDMTELYMIAIWIKQLMMIRNYYERYEHHWMNMKYEWIAFKFRTWALIWAGQLGYDEELARYWIGTSLFDEDCYALFGIGW